MDNSVVEASRIFVKFLATSIYIKYLSFVGWSPNWTTSMECDTQCTYCTVLWLPIFNAPVGTIYSKITATFNWKGERYPSHSRFRGSVNCGAPSMENRFPNAKFLFEVWKASPKVQFTNLVNKMNKTWVIFCLTKKMLTKSITNFMPSQTPHDFFRLTHSSKPKPENLLY